MRRASDAERTIRDPQAKHASVAARIKEITEARRSICFAVHAEAKVSKKRAAPKLTLSGSAHSRP
jgi:hypothetical protein